MAENTPSSDVADTALPLLVPTKTFALVASILSMSWPIALSQFVLWLQSFFTMWLLGTSAKLSMAAYGLANVLCNVTGHCLLWGIGAGLDTLVSQAWGAREYRAIGLYMQRVLLILTLLVNLPVVAIWFNATPLLVGLGQDPNVADKVAAYARWRTIGLFMQGPVCVLQKTLQAMGKTRAVAFAGVTGVAFSMSFSWLLMASASPAARWLAHQGIDVVGSSAIAASAVDTAGALILVAFAVCDRDCRRCWPGWSVQCWRGWAAYLRLAVPALLMGIFEWWSWDIVNFLSGLCHDATGQHDPQTSLATNALLGNIISLAYCLPIGLQTGTQTLVGNALGSQSPESAKGVARVGLAMGCLVMVAQAAALVALRGVWAHLFTAEPAVGQYVTALIPWVVLFNGGDGVQIVLSGVITGAGKQALTTPVLCLAYWVLGLPLGSVAAFYKPRNGLLGLWWGMTIAVWLHVLSYLVICFAHPHVRRFSIDWEQAAQLATDRLAEPAADAASAGALSRADEGGGSGVLGDLGGTTSINASPPAAWRHARAPLLAADAQAGEAQPQTRSTTHAGTHCEAVYRIES